MRRYALLALLLVVLDPAASFSAACRGDCSGDGAVTVDELITLVNIALGDTGLETCSSADGNADGVLAIDELVTAVNQALYGCPVDTPTATPTETVPPMIPSVTPTPTPTEPLPIPTTAKELLAWLRAGNYLGWTAESAPHPSAGPHFGTVRTFLNPTVFASLAAGQAAHPSGSALVKELYGSGRQVQGWDVMLKAQDDSAGGAGWYWLEYFAGATYADGFGVPVCTGCHSLGNDFVRSQFPLQ